MGAKRYILQAFARVCMRVLQVPMLNLAPSSAADPEHQDSRVRAAVVDPEADLIPQYELAHKHGAEGKPFP